MVRNFHEIAYRCNGKWVGTHFVIIRLRGHKEAARSMQGGQAAPLAPLAPLS